MKGSSGAFLFAAVMTAWYVSLLVRGEVTVFGSGADVMRALCLGVLWAASSGIRGKEQQNEQTERKAKALGGTVLK